jgi:hypothetical protein
MPGDYLNRNNARWLAHSAKTFSMEYNGDRKEFFFTINHNFPIPEARRHDWVPCSYNSVDIDYFDKTLKDLLGEGYTEINPYTTWPELCTPNES